MAISLVPKYVRALAEQMNAYFRVFRGADPDSIDLRLNGGGHFIVHHSGTNAAVFTVTDAGATGSYQPGDITNADLADGAVTSAKILDDTITNADVNAAAAIAVTKLAHVGANNVLRSTGTQNVGGQVVSGDIANDTIVDADVNSAAGILVTKIAHVGAGNVLRSTGTQNIGGPLVAADIPNSSITSAKIVDNEIVNGDINASAGILISKLADVGANNVLRSSGSGNVAGKIVSGDIADGTIVDADVAAAGTANIALGKLAPGTAGVLKSNGTAISAGNAIVTGDMVVNTINGDRMLDASIPSSKISGGATIPANSIDSSHIVDGSIMAADLNATAAMVKLGEVAGTGAAAVMEIAAIPGTYRSLHIEATLRSTAAAASTFANLTFETSPTTNYHYQRMYGIAATSAAAEAFSQLQIFAGVVPAASAVVTIFATLSADLPEYATAGVMKPVLARSAGATGVSTTLITADHTYGVFNQSAAITRVRIAATAGNWAAGSRMTLWGRPA